MNLAYVTAEDREAGTNLTDNNIHLATQVADQANHVVTKDAAIATMKKTDAPTPGENQDPEDKPIGPGHQETRRLGLQEGKLVKQSVIMDPWSWKARWRIMQVQSGWTQGKSNILEQDGQ